MLKVFAFCALALAFEQGWFIGCTLVAGARAALVRLVSPEFRMQIKFLQGSIFRLHCGA